ncbi:MAG: putative metallocarboxypeptidase ecm14 [Thelocarpon impressellum]|nr:MAG: putative metallocarboxypeptidase ecm14 [Thelocarpon impressellum]
MRFFPPLASVTLLSLLHAATFFPAGAHATPSRTSERPPSNQFDPPAPPRRQIEPARRPWTRLRDSLSQRIFRAPGDAGPEGAGRARPLRGDGRPAAEAPADLLARYGGDVVLRFNVSSVDEAKSLAEASNILFLDVWEFRDDWVDIRLSKDVVPSLLGLLPASLQHAHTPLMHDLAQAIYESYPSPALADLRPHSISRHAFGPALRSSAESTDNIFFRDYQPLSVIVPWMRLLRSLFPTHVRLFNVGISYEGRDIPALRLGVRPASSQEQPGRRKTIVVTGGSHAREWIGTSTVNYIAYMLITSYGKSAPVTRLLEEFDWVFVPTINPDGYVYSWENDRLWRKNRQQTSLRFCRGVDLDRGWGFQWDGEGAPGNPCSESYPGEEPFAAVESRRLAEWARDEVEQHGADIVGFLDLHSYSQQVLFPYSYSCSSSPPLLENLEELALGLAKAIRLSRGEHYSVTSACEGSVGQGAKGKRKQLHPRMETGGGSALDWFSHELGVRYAYQIKLRDTGSYGFLLPKENIVPTGEEAFAAIQHFGRFLLSGSSGAEAEEEAAAASGDEAPVEPLTKHATTVVELWHESAEGAPEGGMCCELKRRKRR